MKKLTADDPETKSADLVAENLAHLQAIFPQAFTEGRIDFAVLRQLLGGAVDDSPEKYGLNWHGKRAFRQLALTPSTGTLLPCEADSVDWDTTQNLIIEGDNLEVLKLLQKSYAGKVRVICIDPPYNTGKDFVYPDDFQDNIANYKNLTSQNRTSNPETSGRFHTDWLNMMYPRLQLARQLLCDDGLILVFIDDNEVHHLRELMNETFGDENFVATIIWKHAQQSKNDERYFSRQFNYLIAFRKSDSLVSLRLPRTEKHNKNYSNPDNDPRGDWRSGDVRSPNFRSTLVYDVTAPSGKKIGAPEIGWRWSKETMAEMIASGEVVFSKDESKIIRKIYLVEQNGRTPENIWSGEEYGTTRSANQELKDLFDDVVPFDTPKPTALIRQALQLIPDSKDFIVLDFFAGSGTTGHAVAAQNAEDEGNRRYVLVQLPEPLDSTKKEQKVSAEFCDSLGKPRNIAELTKERLRRAAKTIRDEHPDYTGDLGFRVFKFDSSNIKEWDPNREVTNENLLSHSEHLVEGRTDEDVLYELLLKLGLDLTVPIEEKTIGGHTVYSIGMGKLMVCLAKDVTHKAVEPLAMGIVKWHKELKPEGDVSLVFKDSGFADDVAKSNLTAILEQHGLKNVRSV